MFQNKHITDTICPFCEKLGSETGNPQVDGRDFYVENECPHCGMSWKDVYEPVEMFDECPACGGNDIYASAPQADGPLGWVTCECEARDCGAVWSDEYKYSYSEE